MDELDILKNKIANNEILLLEYENEKKVLTTKNIDLEKEIKILKHEHDNKSNIIKAE